MAKSPRKPSSLKSAKTRKAKAGRPTAVVTPMEQARQHLEAERERFDARKRQAIAKAEQEIDDVDKAILMWTLKVPGLTQQQIADLIGYSRDQVNARMNLPKFKRALQIATRPALEVFEGNKARAARKLGELIDDPDSRIAIRAAIAHMWPEIHQGNTGKGEDFVTFIQEAFERAQTKPADPKAAGE